MENVVSARRLRKSALYGAKNYEFTDFTNVRKENSKKKISYLDKLLIRSLISCILLFVSILVVKLCGSKIIENKVINRLYQHYRFNFSRELICENFEDSIRNFNDLMGDIIPRKIRDVVVDGYYKYVKPFFINFNIVTLFKTAKENEVNIYIDSENGLNGKLSDVEEKNVTDEIEYNIYNLPKILPTCGVITSRFGEREKIFSELSTNHTGIDIANNLGTDIVSSTDGVVSKVICNDKYYGNFIEINSYGFVFKYAHLNEILVKENDNITMGDVIAKMGSTGMSTGPHLHFEIIVDGNVINPESVMKFE